MQSEILKCPKCSQEYDLYYDENDEVVAQTKCKCIRPRIKIIDEFIKRMKDEKHFSSSRKVSKSAKANK